MADERSRRSRASAPAKKAAPATRTPRTRTRAAAPEEPEPAAVPATTGPTLSDEDFARIVLTLNSGRPPEKAALAYVRRLRASFKTYLTRDLPRRLVIAGAMGVIAWVANVVIMARNYDGFRVPSGSVASGQGNRLFGTIWWFLFSALVSAVIGYRLKVGGPRFRQAVRDLPSTFPELVRADGSAAASHLLWGFAGTMVVVLFLAPSLSGLFAVGMVLLIGGVLRSVLVGMLMLGWRTVVGRLSPDRGKPPGPLTVSVGAMGGTLALGIGYIVAGGGRMLLGAAAAVGAYVLGRREGHRISPTAFVLVLFGLAVVALLTTGGAPAWADDGGWVECGHPGFLGYITDCTGSATVMEEALWGAIGAIIGALVGEGLGEGTGEEPPVEGGGSGCVPCDAARANAMRKELQDWMNGGGDPGGGTGYEEAMAMMDKVNRMDREIDAIDAELADMEDSVIAARFAINRIKQIKEPTIMDGINNLWEEAANYGTGFKTSLWDDLASGAACERMAQTIEKLPGKTIQAGLDTGAFLLSMPKMIGVAGEFYTTASGSEIGAAYKEFGKENVDNFINGMKDLERASKTGDTAAVTDWVSAAGGSAMFDAISGWGVGKAMTAAKKRFGPAAGAVEEVLDTPEKRTARGVSEPVNETMQTHADDHKISPEMRTRDPNAVTWEGKAYMKGPGQGTITSIKDIDHTLGFNGGADKNGLLGVYKPQLPKNPTKDQLARYTQKLAEYERYQPKIGGGKSVEMEVRINGERRNVRFTMDKDGVLRHPQTGRPVVSDYDGWAASKPNGRRLGYDENGRKLTNVTQQSADRRAYMKFLNSLMKSPMQMQHNLTSIDWAPVAELLLEGGNAASKFDCDTLAKAMRSVKGVYNEGVVKWIPGADNPVWTKNATGIAKGVPGMGLAAPGRAAGTAGSAAVSGASGTLDAAAPARNGWDLLNAAMDGLGKGQPLGDVIKNMTKANATAGPGGGGKPPAGGGKPLPPPKPSPAPAPGKPK